MNDHQQLIAKFYTAFQQKDWKTMQSCYHEEIQFSDPVFTGLKGKEAKAMWHMLAVNARNFSLTFKGVLAGDLTGTCHWEATYSFSKTGRQVINKIDASFEFKDGLIYRHNDQFNFWKWTRMALGASGVLLGWSSFLQNKVRSTAMGGLRKFMADHPEYQ